MKKVLCSALLLLALFSLSACSRIANDSHNAKYSSEIYSDAEIEAAIDVATDYFEKEFEGCTLTGITYIGDDGLDDFREFAERNAADDVLVLISSFDVALSGADGSLNPGSSYTGWNWILVRSGNGQWRHVDHGY